MWRNALPGHQMALITSVASSLKSDRLSAGVASAAIITSAFAYLQKCERSSHCLRRRANCRTYARHSLVASHRTKEMTQPSPINRHGISLVGQCSSSPHCLNAAPTMLQLRQKPPAVSRARCHIGVHVSRSRCRIGCTWCVRGVWCLGRSVSLVPALCSRAQAS